MGDLPERIRETKVANCRMFAYEKKLTEHLLRWVDETNPQHYNRNHFVALQPLTSEDIAFIIEEQKNSDLQGFILKSPWKLPDALIKTFALSEERQLIWAQVNGGCRSCSVNPFVTIHDCQQEDISEQLLQLCLSDVSNQSEQKWIRSAVEEVLIVAQKNPNYHWLLACHAEEAAGYCYAFQANGLVQMEDLWVAETYRRQNIASTMLSYVQTHFEGTLFFHSEDNDTLREIYAKMGFDIVGEQYEYSKVWRK